MKLRALIVALVVLGGAQAARAAEPLGVAVQITPPADVDNPSAVCFTASIDHALITNYELDLLRPDSSLLQTLNVGKPAPDAAGTVCSAINVQPIAFAAGYVARVRAIAGTAASAYALSTNKFNRVPGAPTKVIVK